MGNLKNPLKASELHLPMARISASGTPAASRTVGLAALRGVRTEEDCQRESPIRTLGS